MKIIQLDKDNRMLRPLGIGKNKGVWFLRVDLWWFGIRWGGNVLEQVSALTDRSDVSKCESAAAPSEALVIPPHHVFPKRNLPLVLRGRKIAKLRNDVGLNATQFSVDILQAFLKEPVQFGMKPNHAHLLRGYEVACKYGVMESAAFKLSEDMFNAFFSTESEHSNAHSQV